MRQREREGKRNIHILYKNIYRERELEGQREGEKREGKREREEEGGSRERERD